MSLNDVIAGFPVSLFLTLAGVTLLFTSGAAQRHPRSHRPSRRAALPWQRRTHPDHVLRAWRARWRRWARATSRRPRCWRRWRWPPPGRAGIPAFLMIIMVGNGAQAGSLSPFAPTGIIVNGLMTKIGLSGHEWFTYWTNLVAHAVVAFGGYFAVRRARRCSGRLGRAAGGDRGRDPARAPARDDDCRHRGAVRRRPGLWRQRRHGCVRRGGRARCRSAPPITRTP